MSRETDSKNKRKKMGKDPTLHRGDFGDIKTFIRKTPTVKFRQERRQKKHKNKIWNLEN